jgi:hypothetical protein
LIIRLVRSVVHITDPDHPAKRAGRLTTPRPDCRRSSTPCTTAAQVTDVGGGKLIASVMDADGNIIDLIPPA